MTFVSIKVQNSYLRSIATNVADCRFLLLFLPEVEIIPQEEIMLGVKMFSRKSGFVPCLTTLQKCNLHVGPLGLRWHCDAASWWKALKQEISFALISSSNRNSAPSILTGPRVSKATGTNVGVAGSNIYFGRYANRTLVRCRECQNLCLWHSFDKQFIQRVCDISVLFTVVA